MEPNEMKNSLEIQLEIRHQGTNVSELEEIMEETIQTEAHREKV